MDQELHAVVAAANAVDQNRIKGVITPPHQLLEFGRSLEALRAADPQSQLGKHINERVEIPVMTRLDFNAPACKRLRGLACIISEWAKLGRFKEWMEPRE